MHHYPFWKDFPCGLGGNVNMLADLNLRVSVHASQGDPVDFPLICPAHGGATTAAKLQAKTLIALIRSQ